MQCKECLFWVREEKETENQGDCRRYPPTAFLGQRLNQIVQKVDLTVTTVYPKTMGHLWCGEFVDKSGIKS